MGEESPLHEQTAAAVFTDEAGLAVPAHFGDPAAEYRHAHQAAILVDQSARGKVEVRGADAARFLHNLTTNDMLHLAPGAGCEAFLTTAKARVIAYLLVYRLDAPADPPTFWLDAAPGTAEKLVEYLDRYLISEQVEFANSTRAFAQMHLAGPQAAALLGSVLPEIALPAEVLRLVSSPAGSLQVRRHDALGLPGYDLLCPADQAASLWQRLVQAGARPAGREACEVLRIEAGLPREGADIDENTFAPEVGRIAGAICYTKGCYLGQESIVMARDRGQVNRSLVGVRLAHGPVPRDTPLFAQEKQAGRVTSSAVSPRLEAGIGLAYVRRAYGEPGTKLEAEVEGQRFAAEVIALPVTVRGAGE